MNETERASVIYTAGQVAGLALRFTAEHYREAAETPGLDPVYRETIRALAQFREVLERGG